MGYILCIAEKSSVGKDIARIVEANQRKEGYCEGNGNIVTLVTEQSLRLWENREPK